MEIILIISTLVAFLFTAVLWKTWKWFEYEAWIGPATMEAFCNAILLVAPAIIQAAQASSEFGVIMAQAQLQSERIKRKLEPGGFVSEIRIADKDGKCFVVEELEVGEQKDGAWPIRATGYPIGPTKEEIILRGRATGKDWLFDGKGQVGRISDDIPLPE